MKGLFIKIRELLTDLAVAVFFGFIGGLMIGMAVFAARHSPFWCLGFTLFFALFHLNDLKRFLSERNWMALAGRLVILFAMTSSIVSLFVFALSNNLKMDIFDGLVFAVVLPLSMLTMLAWTLLTKFGTETRVYKEFLKIADGLEVIGVLWKN